MYYLLGASSHDLYTWFFKGGLTPTAQKISRSTPDPKSGGKYIDAFCRISAAKRPPGSSLINGFIKATPPYSTLI